MAKTQKDKKRHLIITILGLFAIISLIGIVLTAISVIEKDIKNKQLHKYDTLLSLIQKNEKRIKQNSKKHDSCNILNLSSNSIIDDKQNICLNLNINKLFNYIKNKTTKENSFISDNEIYKIIYYSLKSKYSVLMLAIIEEESKFNPYLFQNGRIGLTQIHISESENFLKVQSIIYSNNELFRIKTNIIATEILLNWYLCKTKDLKKAILIFHYGKLVEKDVDNFYQKILNTTLNILIYCKEIETL